MTKQRNKVNIIVLSIFIVIELAAAIGAYVANYFTRTRMGMLRHVIFLNGKWERQFNIPMIKWIAIAVIVVSLVLVCFMYLRQRKRSITKTTVTIITLLVSMFTISFILFFNKETNRAYYIMSICFLIMAVFQNILFYCYNFMKRKNKFN